MDLVTRAESRKWEIVDELWLRDYIKSDMKKAIDLNDIPMVNKRNIINPDYKRKYPEDTFLEELLALENENSGYKVGMKCYKQDNPDQIYVITNLHLCISEKVVATLALPNNPTESSQTVTLIDDYVEASNFLFVRTEEQLEFMKKYENREATVAEGIGRFQIPSDVTSTTNHLFDQFALYEVCDYVSGTNNVVRTLVDPSLYAVRVSIWSLSFWWNWMVSDCPKLSHIFVEPQNLLL